MYYPEETVQEVCAANDIVDVVGQVVRLKRKGASYFGLCPFHNEKTPSFSVTPGKQIFYCFGCGAGGDVVSFVMNYENMTFPEAVKSLADRVGYHLPEVSLSEEGRARKREKERILAVLKEAASFYYKLLRSPAGENGMEYLKKRGIGDNIMQSFGLGYAGKKSGVTIFLKERGYSDNEINAAGLVYMDEKRGMRDRFFNRVIFPIMDVNNHVIGFGGRVMGDGEPKYLNSPETVIFDKGKNLYGLNAARKSRRGYMIACEGYMDVISMHQAGFTEAVASLGTAFTPDH
ncbi:MAG: DNA primase, partial [Lachnospiraceae bacterium]|nr:DNA primase [Lachnospiraceae bacterium]